MIHISYYLFTWWILCGLYSAFLFIHFGRKKTSDIEEDVVFNTPIGMAITYVVFAAFGLITSPIAIAGTVFLLIGFPEDDD